MKHLSLTGAIRTLLLGASIATGLSACVVLYPTQPECAMSAEIPANSNRVCASALVASKPATAVLQINDAGNAWTLSMTGPDPIPNSQAALMPKQVNDAGEVVRPQRLAFIEDRLDVEFAYPTQRGGSDLIMYRLSLRLIDNAWRVTDYASAFRQRGQARYRVNSADLRTLKMMTCDSDTAFACPTGQRTTALVKQTLMPLSDMPMLPEYSLKPDVKTMIR